MQWRFQSQKRCKDKMKLKETSIEPWLPRKKMKGQIRVHSLPKPKAKMEDSSSIEGFLSVWGFNGEQRWFVVANGGCG